MNDRRRGFVLATVLALLVIGSALMAGAFFYALQEERLGRNAQAAARALAAAESGADLALAGWVPGSAERLAPGDSLTGAVALPSGAGSADVTLAALGDQLVLIRAQGEDPTHVARRGVAVLGRLLLPPFAAPAALTVTRAPAGSLAGAADGSAHGVDGWTCAADSEVNVPLVAPWGGAWSDYDSLAARAVVGPVMPDASEPAVRVAGDLRLTGASGVGVLLVDGDATLDGTTLVGILMVRGTLRVTGASSRLVGAVRAGAVWADSGVLDGGPLVSWSACAVLLARRNLAGLARITGWSWADLSGGW